MSVTTDNMYLLQEVCSKLLQKVEKPFPQNYRDVTEYVLESGLNSILRGVFEMTPEEADKKEQEINSGDESFLEEYFFHMKQWALNQFPDHKDIYNFICEVEEAGY